MKRVMTVLMAVLCLLTAVLPVTAAPYTEQELEEYMEAIYCEQVWAQDFSDFQVQFIDIDFDGRFELVTMETGEEYAPKSANFYAFMDAELSGRGNVSVGKLEVCRDPDTHETFVVNRVERDGQIFHQRLTYHSEMVGVTAQGLTATYAENLEDYGYSPVTVTKEQFAQVKVYEDCRALFLPAYQNTVYKNGEPPIVEPQYGDSASTYTDVDAPADMTPYWIAGGVVTAAVVAATAAVLVLRCRKGKMPEKASSKATKRR